MGGLLRFLDVFSKEFIRLWDTLLLMRMDSAKSVSSFRLRGVVLLGLMLVLLVGGRETAFAAAPDATAPAVLKVEGAVTTPLSLTAEDLDKMPRATATLTADGNATTYEGVLLYDILVKAGWQFGRGMTGKGMASYVIATAKDGYQVVFALAEIDPMFGGAKVIIADKADGAALPATQQPFRVVAPGDKMHARSIYSLLKVEVVRLRP
jgi:DMSO/TMAO reductase YedYZ molybdopterin-dependent catalytic subunit